jgi:hypothetical protein
MRPQRSPSANHGMHSLPVHAAFALAVVALLLREFLRPVWAF